MNAAPAGAFAASDDGARWTYAGALTFANAESVLEAARALPLPTSRVADLAGLEHADSAAIVVLLAVKRRALAEGAAIDFVSVPGAIVSLARVYGIDALLGV